MPSFRATSTAAAQSSSGMEAFPFRFRLHSSNRALASSSVIDPVLLRGMTFLLAGCPAAERPYQLSGHNSCSLAENSQHYSDVGFLHPVAFGQDQLLYASYRRGHSIYWTKEPVRVRAGELVLADRSGNLIRGRCGNRLSEAPQLPVSAYQPAEVATDLPEVSFPEALLLEPGPLADPALSLFDPALPDPDPSTRCAQGVLDSGCPIEDTPFPVCSLFGQEKEAAVPSAPGALPPGILLPGPIAPFIASNPPGDPSPAAAAPEPGSVVLLGAGALVLAASRRRGARV